MQRKIELLNLFLTLCLSAALAQNTTLKSTTTPKMGLTLSGGGIKGLAHIGVLQMIDSLDIRIDCISATSMGSIVGAMYAAGYSGDDIKRIALNDIDWSRMLSNAPPFNEVTFEEKDEFGRYALELPMTGWRPTAPRAFIEGQYVLGLFNYYTHNVHHISRFSKLPIPLRLMGSDILNGGSVRLDSGSLAVAMRASMAIPVVFTPLFCNGYLLVDGGLDKNFAVDEALDMGATQVIGSYTGFRVYDKSEISSPAKLIAQTYAFSSVKNATAQMKRATLVINHNDALKKYSPTDFANYADIIRIGEIEARKMLPELQRLADEQHRHPTAPKPQHPADPQLPIDKIDFLTTTDQNIPPSVQKFAAARLGLKVDSIYTANQIRQATNRLYGSRFFDNVYLAFDSTRLRVHLKNDDPDYLKVGLHYDSYGSVSVIVNYTRRHLGLPKCRFVATLAASERLKGRANYQFYVDKKFRFWSKTFLNYENQTGKEVIGQYEDAQNYNAERYDYGTGLGYSRGVNSSFFLSFQREHHLLRRNRALRLLFDDVPIYAYNHVSNSLNLN